MQGDQTDPNTADELSSLSWVDYLAQKAPEAAPPRRLWFEPRARAYTAMMLTVLLLLAVYGLASGNAAGVIIVVVLVAFLLLPVGIVVILEGRHPPASPETARRAGIPPHRT